MDRLVDFNYFVNRNNTVMNITDMYFWELIQSVSIVDFSLSTLAIQVILGGNVSPTFCPWCSLMGLKTANLDNPVIHYTSRGEKMRWASSSLFPGVRRLPGRAGSGEWLARPTRPWSVSTCRMQSSVTRQKLYSAEVKATDGCRQTPAVALSHVNGGCTPARRVQELLLMGFRSQLCHQRTLRLSCGSECGDMTLGRLMSVHPKSFLSKTQMISTSVFTSSKIQWEDKLKCFIHTERSMSVSSEFHLSTSNLYYLEKTDSNSGLSKST